MSKKITTARCSFLKCIHVQHKDIKKRQEKDERRINADEEIAD